MKNLYSFKHPAIPTRIVSRMISKPPPKGSWNRMLSFDIRKQAEASVSLSHLVNM